MTGKGRVMRVIVIGAGGGLGRALVNEYLKRGASIEAISRQAEPTDLPAEARWWQVEGTLAEYQQVFSALGDEAIQPDVVISAIGWLHQNEWQPERRIEALTMEQLQAYFEINASLPVLLLQALKPLLPKSRPCTVLQLGAKVGSIGDNQLGGWYGYRASKAALNMLYKTAAIEFRRTHKALCLAVVHPGTTDTGLSQPFQQRIAAGKLYSAEQSAERIANVAEGLTAAQSGGFWFWDGSPLPY
ncbi:short-chain dehydrogenase [Aliidiomarina soli]|uniref:Short-chain dehydrogenase n=2 Tax=Aliidiomarina soli TaxID=1928574 RepID=A0A432WF36_9GAMM|nr:short-chain dehydrogenase [Aliidiomarina soli]